MKKRVEKNLMRALAILCIIVAVSYPIGVQASASGGGMEDTINPLNLYIRTCSSSLSISGSTATCTGTVSAYASAASSVGIKLTLQKNSSGWQDVKSWSSTVNSNTGMLSKTHTIGSGTYRVRGEFTAGSETITVFSSTVTK